MASPCPVASFELGEFLTIDGALRGIVQHGRYNNATGEMDKKLDRETRGAAIVDLEIDVAPTPLDTFWARLRFAVGNSLNNVGGVELPPYNGPLDDDVKNINESGRDYLLEGWYRHTFTLSSETRIAVTGGIIDSTNYIDENRYANDEDTQFMSPAFSTPDNRPGAPSYDPGVALELQGDGWSLKGVYMDTSNEFSDDIDYLGIQAAYHYTSATRPGNYRILAYTAEGRLKDSKAQSGRARMHGLGVSIDQELGEDWGIFFRAFMQNDDAPMVYDKDVSGGISIGGRHWGRPDDTLGIAYARLIGSGRQKIDHSDIAEAYVKFQLLRSIDFTVDVQYEKDHTESVKGNPQAWILGGRLNFEF
jgi:porin